jgi:hypothetical protein
MDRLTAFGFIAVSLMLIFYALEHYSHWFILCFASACALSAVYGYLQRAMPFAFVEGIWTLVALWRWWHTPPF